MKYKKEFNALVIVGAWNHSIFNNEWVSKNILPDEKKLEIEIPVNVVGSMRISTKDLRIFTNVNKLNFSILNHNDLIFEKIGELATKVARYLIHTPVSAFGINFSFENEIDEELEKFFILNDSKILTQNGFNANDFLIKRSFPNENYTMNYFVKKEKEKYIFDFNYHFDIKSIPQFLDMFEISKILEFKSESLNLLSSCYNLNLD
jgi:hypothetical protein